MFPAMCHATPRPPQRALVEHAAHRLSLTLVCFVSNHLRYPPYVEQVLLLELGSPAEFLDRAVEPPPPKMLRAALRNLYDLQVRQRCSVCFLHGLTETCTFIHLVLRLRNGAPLFKVVSGA